LTFHNAAKLCLGFPKRVKMYGYCNAQGRPYVVALAAIPPQILLLLERHRLASIDMLYAEGLYLFI